MAQLKKPQSVSDHARKVSWSLFNLKFELMMLCCVKKRSFFRYFLRGDEVCMFLAPGVHEV